MNVCTFCGQEKYNFDMIQEYDGHGTNRMFCSMKCLGYSAEPILAVNEEADASVLNETALDATQLRVDRIVGCHPDMEAKATQSTSIEKRHARTQTEAWSANAVIPIPVPMYVPQPCLIPLLFLRPMPFLLPMVVPIVLTVNNLIARFTREPRSGSNVTSVATISEAAHINVNLLTPPSLASNNSDSSSSLYQASGSESSNDHGLRIAREFETSTPIQSSAGDFLCNNKTVSVLNGSASKPRRLKPDLSFDDFKVEDESNDGSISSVQSASVDTRTSRKRSFSEVDSEELSESNASKKSKDALSATTIFEDDEI